MEKGLFEVLTEICNEKGISQEVLIDALEAALVAAYKKNFYSAQNVEVSIDRESGTVKVFAKKEVVDLVYDEFEEISLEDARAINGNYQIGDKYRSNTERFWQNQCNDCKTSCYAENKRG